jgi:hypothetical protein
MSLPMTEQIIPTAQTTDLFARAFGRPFLTISSQKAVIGLGCWYYAAEIQAIMRQLDVVQLLTEAEYLVCLLICLVELTPDKSIDQLAMQHGPQPLRPV